MNEKRGKVLPVFGNGNNTVNSGSNGSNSASKNRNDNRTKTDNQLNGGIRRGKSAPIMNQVLSGNNSARTNQNGRPSSKTSDPNGKMYSQQYEKVDYEAHKLNADVCKRMDPEFSKIIKVATQVAIFDYDCQGKKWNNKDIFGCLFFYERKTLPAYGLSILNRKSLNNFALLLKSDIQLQVDLPHILIRDEDVIRCLWFYNQSECVEIAEDINKRIKFAQPAPGQTIMSNARSVPRDKTPEPEKQQQGNHILSMLCQRVQVTSITEVTKSAPMTPTNKDSPRTLPFTFDGNASNASALQAFFGLPTQPGTQTEAPGRDSDENSVQSNRTIPGTSGNGAGKLDSLGDELRATLGIINKPDASSPWRSEWEGDEINGVDGTDMDNIGDKLLPLLPSADTTQTYLNSIEDFFSAPQQFYKAESMHSAASRSKTGNNDNGSICGSATELGRTALNKEQMLQAFTYLLETDPEFTERLHKAYLSSLERNK